jgi:hypothetical protein
MDSAPPETGAPAAALPAEPATEDEAPPPIPEGAPPAPVDGFSSVEQAAMASIANQSQLLCIERASRIV